MQSDLIKRRPHMKAFFFFFLHGAKKILWLKLDKNDGFPQKRLKSWQWGRRWGHWGPWNGPWSWWICAAWSIQIGSNLSFDLSLSHTHTHTRDSRDTNEQHTAWNINHTTQPNPSLFCMEKNPSRPLLHLYCIQPFSNYLAAEPEDLLWIQRLFNERSGDMSASHWHHHHRHDHHRRCCFPIGGAALVTALSPSCHANQQECPWSGVRMTMAHLPSVTEQADWECLQLSLMIITVWSRWIKWLIISRQ